MISANLLLIAAANIADKQSRIVVFIILTVMQIQQLLTIRRRSKRKTFVVAKTAARGDIRGELLLVAAVNRHGHQRVNRAVAPVDNLPFTNHINHPLTVSG